jgi:hypothetical protein
MIDGFNERERRHRNDLLSLAWYGEAFARTKNLPKLEDLLTERKRSDEPKREQTPEEMMAVCRMLNAAFGGDEIEV